MTDPLQQFVQLRLDVTIEQHLAGFGALRFSEQVEIPARDFQALAKILSRFHELFQEIKRQEKSA